jgi:signal transduction histidine kinase
MSTVDPAPTVYDLLPDGVVIADEAGRIVMINEVAKTILGSAVDIGKGLSSLPLQDQQGHDWFATVTPYDGLPSRTGIPEQAWFTTDGTELLVSTRLRRPGRGMPIETVALVLRSARGRAILDRERSDLVATVAHELRSPLTGVKGFVTTLLNKWELLNDEQKKLMLTTVSVDSERLSRLITELLDVARIDTGRLPLYPRPALVVPLVERVVALVRAGTARRIVTEHADPGIEILADPDKFAQVVTNLVDNAVRHGEGDVLVRTAMVERPVRGLELVVEDHGDGIAEEVRARVFTKFWKHGASGGSGLGMYLVHGLTRAHGGDVVIGTAPGGGASLVVHWPAPDPGETG